MTEIEAVEAYGLTFTIPANDTGVGAALRKHGEFARPEVDFIQEACGGDLLDVGANIGAICLPFAKQKPAARVVAVEAQPEIVQILETNIAANGLSNVSVIAAVAGEGPGEFQMPLVSLEQTTNVGASSLYMPSERMARARMVSIDDIAPEHVQFVKIDVEGFEPRVLAGGARLLRDRRPRWLIEVSKEREEQAISVLRTLTAAGYGVFWFFSPFVTRAIDGKVRGDLSVFACDGAPPWALPAVQSHWPSDIGVFPYIQRYGLVGLRKG